MTKTSNIENKNYRQIKGRRVQQNKIKKEIQIIFLSILNFSFSKFDIESKVEYMCIHIPSKKYNIWNTCFLESKVFKNSLQDLETP